MSARSYSRLWVHLTWATKERHGVLLPPVRTRVHDHLHEYSSENGIFLKRCFVNADHVHALVDLPTNLSVEGAVKTLKGESSHWINQERLTHSSFHWQQGYGAFSVSHSMLDTVCRYIANQELHHRKKTFAEELQEFVKRCGLEWRGREIVETIRGNCAPCDPGMNSGANVRKKAARESAR